jgi:hypothetical protein
MIAQASRPLIAATSGRSDLGGARLFWQTLQNWTRSCGRTRRRARFDLNEAREEYER